MFVKKTSFVLLLIASLGSSSIFANENPIKKSFPFSIVEVLIDRIKDDQAELNRAIPVQKIPFKQRTDRYQSIGTAWFMSDKELFSAAHVFSSKLAAFTKNFYVRTITGDVYPVDMVTLYSNRYDIVSFTLKSYPQKIEPILLARGYNIGDDVCVPGNALGQGISLRCGGQISSLAPEPKNGEWKEIYFSTPVSPGNSGGPLVDSVGRAIGIVIRKIPGEDLNIAVPFNELKTQKSRLEHFEKDLGYQNSIVQPLYANADFSVGSNQSMPVMTWLNLVMAGTNDHLMRMTKLYESSWYRNGVLNSAPARNYLRNPKRGQYFTQVRFVNLDLSQVDGDEGEFERIGRTRRRIVLQKIAKKSMFFIGKNPGERTDALLNNPKEMMNSVLATGKGLQRKIADEDLYYTTLGYPSSVGQMDDLLGRRWMLFSWKLYEVGSTIDLFCTPRPSDVACSFSSRDSMYTPETVAALFRVDISELTLSYPGSTSEWTEFLTINNRFKPAFMSGISIKKQEGKTRIMAQELSIIAPSQAAASDSVVMNFSSDVANPLRQQAYAISYSPNLAERLTVSAVKFYKTGKTPGAVESVYKTRTGKFMAAKLIDQKNSAMAVMGYMYGDEQLKLNRMWKSTDFGMNVLQVSK